MLDMVSVDCLSGKTINPAAILIIFLSKSFQLCYTVLVGFTGLVEKIFYFDINIVQYNEYKHNGLKNKLHYNSHDFHSMIHNLM